MFSFPNELFECFQFFHFLKFLIILKTLLSPFTLFFRVSKLITKFISCPAQLGTIKTFKVTEYWPKLLVLIKVKWLWNTGITFNLPQEMKCHSLRTTVISCLAIEAIVLHGLHTSPIQFLHLIWNPVILCNSISPFNYLTCSFSWVTTWYCTWTAHIHLTGFSFSFFFFPFYAIFALVWKQVIFI